MHFSIEEQSITQPLSDEKDGPSVTLTFQVDRADTSKGMILVTGGKPEDPVWAVSVNRNGLATGTERLPSPKEAAEAAEKAAAEKAAAEKATAKPKETV